MRHPLRLSRTYSFRSLLGIGGVAVILVLFYRSVAIDNLKTLETGFNVSLARSLSLTLWPHYAEFMHDSQSMPFPALARTPQFQAMKREVNAKISGLRVINVRIYGPQGLMVFSTGSDEIGENHAGAPMVQRAMAGEAASTFLAPVPTSAARTDSVQQNQQRRLLSTFIPIRRDDRAPIEGVFEIQSDITPFVEDVRELSYTILGGVTTLLLLLYGFLLAVVQRADRLLKANEAERSEREQARLDRLARFDGLTDLPNRSYFMTLLNQSLKSEHRNGRGLAAIYIGLDRFKLINDTLKHEQGDRILIEIARRLRACLTESAVLARVGGDQFAILATYIGGEKEARAIAARIIEQINLPIELGGREVALTASIGIALNEGSGNGEALIENAISAMKQAKEYGGNGICCFARDPDSEPGKRLEIEMALRAAVARSEFVLYYQPRISASTGKVVAVEALLRWRHPSRGLVPPAEFVPVLEEIGLMVPVGSWVIAEACRQLRAWTVEFPDLKISVNVSLQQFRSGLLVDEVRSALQRSGVSGSRLELELTESTLADDLESARAIAIEIKKLGVGLAIDDFGTGYSSLGYLIHFPVDCLKIDRIFIADLPDNDRHAALVTAITAMAGSLGLQTVAEGIETAAQDETARRLGCTELQGFWFSEPRPVEEIPDCIAELRERASTTSGPHKRKLSDRKR